MLHGKIHVNVISRALVVLLVALAAACNRHASIPPSGKTADAPLANSPLPEIVITASRLSAGETRYAARAAQASSPPREAHVNRRGG
jgi:hypothetical protein